MSATRFKHTGLGAGSSWPMAYSSHGRPGAAQQVVLNLGLNGGRMREPGTRDGSCLRTGQGRPERSGRCGNQAGNNGDGLGKLLRTFDTTKPDRDGQGLDSPDHCESTSATRGPQLSGRGETSSRCLWQTGARRDMERSSSPFDPPRRPSPLHGPRSIPRAAAVRRRIEWYYAHTNGSFHRRQMTSVRRGLGAGSVCGFPAETSHRGRFSDQVPGRTAAWCWDIHQWRESGFGLQDGDADRVASDHLHHAQTTPLCERAENRSGSVPLQPLTTSSCAMRSLEQVHGKGIAGLMPMLRIGIRVRRAGRASGALVSLAAPRPAPPVKEAQGRHRDRGPWI